MPALLGAAHAGPVTSAPVKVFISWSGHQSRQIAEAFREWLPTIFESVDPYMSARDNEAGVRWNTVVSDQLDASDFGILCLTPDNLQAPWLLFEAGALSKSVDVARVVPLLYKLAPADVTSPLSQFHMKEADEAGIRDIVTTINEALPQSRPEQALTTAFKALWPVLKEKLDAVKAPMMTKKPQRTDRSILEEVLQILRTRRDPVVVSATQPTARHPLSTEIDSAQELVGLHNVLTNMPDVKATIKPNPPNGFLIEVPDRGAADRIVQIMKTYLPGQDPTLFAIRWPDVTEESSEGGVLDKGPR